MNDRSITDILSSLEISDYDTRYLIAATINLYVESRRRVEGRVLLEPTDITAIFAILDQVLNRPFQEISEDRPRPKELTEEEQEKLLQAITPKVNGRRA